MRRCRTGNFPLTGTLGLKAGESIALCGGGGKTSLLYALASENPFDGGLYTTTTKMFNPEEAAHPFDRICLNWNSSSSPAIAGKRIFTAGQILPAAVPGEPSKVQGLSDRWIEIWKNSCSQSILIVEADGAARKPIKYPGPNEPVIPRNTDHMIAVIGLETLGRLPVPDLVHRSELFTARLPLDGEGKISVETVSALIEDDQGLFKNCPSGMSSSGNSAVPVKKSIIFNKMDLLDPSCDIHRMSAVLKCRFPDIRFFTTMLNLPVPVIHTL